MKAKCCLGVRRVLRQWCPLRSNTKTIRRCVGRVRGRLKRILKLNKLISRNRKDTRFVIVSFTPPLGVRNVSFSSLTPPSTTSMFVVLAPSVRFPVSYMSQAPSGSPTRVHALTALQVPDFSPYSRRNPVDEAVTPPSFETATRRRYANPSRASVSAVSSTPPVRDDAPASFPSSARQW